MASTSKRRYGLAFPSPDIQVYDESRRRTGAIMSQHASTPVILVEPGTEAAVLFADTLANVDKRASALRAAANEARHAAPARQRSLLIRLHNQSRDVAAVLNHALGGWPDATDAQP